MLDWRRQAASISKQSLPYSLPSDPHATDLHTIQNTRIQYEICKAPCCRGFRGETFIDVAPQTNEIPPCVEPVCRAEATRDTYAYPLIC